MALAVFKFGWNSIALRRLTKLVLSFAYDVTDGKMAKSILSFELLAALFNNIVIPCAVVAFVEPDCFYTMLVAPPPVTASYTYLACTIPGEGNPETCIEYTPTIGHTSFAAPFTYSYQCSASFTTHYAPAFVNVAILTGFLVPALQLLLLILHSRQLDKLEACVDAPEERSALLASAWTSVLGSPLVGRLLRPVALRPPAAALADQQQQQQQQQHQQQQQQQQMDILNVNGCLIQVVTLLGLLLTFGTVFPPLGVTLAVAMLCYTFYVHRDAKPAKDSTLFAKDFRGHSHRQVPGGPWRGRKCAGDHRHGLGKKRANMAQLAGGSDAVRVGCV